MDLLSAVRFRISSSSSSEPKMEKERLGSYSKEGSITQSPVPGHNTHQPVARGEHLHQLCFLNLVEEEKVRCARQAVLFDGAGSHNGCELVGRCLGRGAGGGAPVRSRQRRDFS